MISFEAIPYALPSSAFMDLWIGVVSPVCVVYFQSISIEGKETGPLSLSDIF
jgi:hypothetical protein